MAEVMHFEGGDVKPPDGGWGWVVVFSSFLIHVIVGGVVFFFHAFLVVFLEDFHGRPVGTELIWELQTDVAYIVGPVAGALTNRYGCRVVTTAGAIISGFSFIFSFLYAHSLYFLYFSSSVMAGLGFGLIYLPAIVIVAQYFEKRRAFAMGLAVCGSGFGTFILTLLTEHLLKIYARRGAILVVGGILLIVIVCGVLFSPLQVPRRSIVSVMVESIEGERRHTGGVPLFALLKGPVFMFGISNFLISIHLTMLFTLPWNRAIETGSGISIIPLVYVISCVVFGYLADMQWVDRLMLYSTALTICGVATALISFFGSNYELFVTYAVICGVFIGVYVTLTSVILVDLLGIELLPSSLGFLLLFQGVASGVGHNVSGWLPDSDGRYEISFVIKVVMIAISGAMLFFLLCKRNTEKVHQIEMGKLQTISISSAETSTFTEADGMFASDPTDQKGV